MKNDKDLKRYREKERTYQEKKNSMNPDREHRPEKRSGIRGIHVYAMRAVCEELVLLQ